MKKYIIVLLIPVFFACGRAAKEEAAKLQARNDSLLNITTQKDVAINEFMKSVNEIQGTLDSIKVKENIISQGAQANGEMKRSMKDQIRGDIASIYSLVLKNKQQIESLYSKLRASGMKLAEFEKLVAHLQREISDKDSTLAILRERLTNMDAAYTAANHRIDTLSNVVQSQGQVLNNQTQVINDQTTTLNTGYYILGTSKELNKQKITKGGKLLPDFNKSLFTRVDIRNSKEIPLQTKKVKLITNHPPSSYKLIMEGKIVKALEVTDEKAFWSTSKYLVLATN
jgi:chromosome segregation ATPase